MTDINNKTNEELAAEYDPWAEGEYDSDEVGLFAFGVWMTWEEYYAECAT